MQVIISGYKNDPNNVLFDLVYPRIQIDESGNGNITISCYDDVEDSDSLREEILVSLRACSIYLIYD